MCVYIYIYILVASAAAAELFEDVADCQFDVETND